MLKRTDLKRTPMPPRSKPIERKPVPKRSKKRKAAIAANRDVLGSYAESHTRCALCGISAFRAYGPDRMLQLHHLAGRGLKHDVVGNFLMLCRRDHRHYHDGRCFGDNGERLPEITHGMLMEAKATTDPQDYSESLIASLNGWQAIPETWERTEIPQAFLDEREINWRTA